MKKRSFSSPLIKTVFGQALFSLRNKRLGKERNLSSLKEVTDTEKVGEREEKELGKQGGVRKGK